MTQIRYKGFYKYQLQQDYLVKTRIVPSSPVCTDYIKLHENGLLEIRKGYARDGPSGPVIDTSENMRSSLVHDALYQLLRNGYLQDPESIRKLADQEFRDMSIEDGVNRWRAWAWYYGLRVGGSPAASYENKKKTLVAPEVT